MLNNPIKTALAHRQTCLGTWIQIGHPAIAEILIKTGFAWLAADCEHGDVDVLQFANLARVAGNQGTIPLVRVQENDTLSIRRALDMGAMGVIVPLVNSAQDAQRAVAAAKYPPDGVRGFAFHRGNDWGRNFEDYTRQANDQIAVIIMIESRQAVDNIDEILSVHGVDGVFIGPYDLSGSYNVVGQTDAQVIQTACQKVSQACRLAGKSAGMHIVTPTEANISRAIEDGFTFLAIGMDTVFLSNSSQISLEIAQKQLQ